MKYLLFLSLLLCLPLNLLGQCDQPPEQGPCNASITRYYFDPDVNDCQTFIYGGCGGNANNYATYDLCMTACAPQCFLPADSGFGPSNQEKWFYNKDTRQCETFVYHGLGGNANRYSSRAECQESCGLDCYLPPERGPCLAILERYYFDPPTGSCKTFIYGGCRGNANNYTTIEACLNACAAPCEQLPFRGPCLAFFTRYYYDKEDDTCRTFTFGGCEANDNNFATFELCMASCPCPKVENDDKYYASGSKRVVNVSDTINSTAIITDTSSIKYRAALQVGFFSGFRIDASSILEISMEECPR